jgi:hypothetical protein
MTEARKSRFTVVELLVVVAIIGVLVAILLPAILASRSAARRTQRNYDLKNVGLAVQNFHDTYREYPASVRRDEMGRPLASWRYRILPFIAAFMMDVDYSQPWDDPEAKYFSMQPLSVYCFPGTQGDMPFNTNVVALEGPGTVFDEMRVDKASDFDDHTVLAIEVAEFDRHWAEPGDLSIDSLSDSHLSGFDGLGLLVVMIDGSVHHVSRDTPVDELKKHMTAGDVEGRDPDLFLR